MASHGGEGSTVFNDVIYLLTAIGLTPGRSSTVHIYTEQHKQTIHRITQTNNT